MLPSGNYDFKRFEAACGYFAKGYKAYCDRVGIEIQTKTLRLLSSGLLHLVPFEEWPVIVRSMARQIGVDDLIDPSPLEHVTPEMMLVIGYAVTSVVVELWANKEGIKLHAFTYQKTGREGADREGHLDHGGGSGPGQEPGTPGD